MSVMTEDYKTKLEIGLHYQDFVIERLYEAGLPVIGYSSKEYQNLVGENMAGIEIKYDRLFRKTGNLYIETAEKSNPANHEYYPSGIFRKDNTWLYVIGDYQTIHVFSKKQLQQVRDRYEQKTTPTSIGYVLPLNEHTLNFMAVKTIEIHK